MGEVHEDHAWRIWLQGYEYAWCVVGNGELFLSGSAENGFMAATHVLRGVGIWRAQCEGKQDAPDVPLSEVARVVKQLPAAPVRPKSEADEAEDFNLYDDGELCDYCSELVNPAELKRVGKAETSAFACQACRDAHKKGKWSKKGGSKAPATSEGIPPEKAAEIRSTLLWAIKALRSVSGTRSEIADRLEALFRKRPVSDSARKMVERSYQRPRPGVTKHPENWGKGFPMCEVCFRRHEPREACEGDPNPPKCSICETKHPIVTKCPRLQ